MTTLGGFWPKMNNRDMEMIDLPKYKVEQKLPY